jgi:hypothetical protein
LWYHNHGLDATGKAVPGIVPFEMATASWPGASPPCEGDFEPADNDVDGADLAVLAAAPGLLDPAIFATHYGRIDCP